MYFCCSSPKTFSSDEKVLKLDCAMYEAPIKLNTLLKHFSLHSENQFLNLNEYEKNLWSN